MKYEVYTNTKFIGVMNGSPTVARSIAFLNLYGYIIKNGTPTIDLDGSWSFDNSFYFKPIKQKGRNYDTKRAHGKNR